MDTGGGNRGRKRRGESGPRPGPSAGDRRRWAAGADGGHPGRVPLHEGYPGVHQGGVQGRVMKGGSCLGGRLTRRGLSQSGRVMGSRVGPVCMGQW